MKQDHCKAFGLRPRTTTPP